MENNIINTKTSKSFFTDSFITICDVVLFSSALNCLFQFLSYTKTFDIVLFVVSLALGLYVYHFALNIRKTPKKEKRLAIAVASLIVWAVLIPIIHMAFV